MKFLNFSSLLALSTTLISSLVLAAPTPFSPAPALSPRLVSADVNVCATISLGAIAFGKGLGADVCLCVDAVADLLKRPQYSPIVTGLLALKVDVAAILTSRILAAAPANAVTTQTCGFVCNQGYKKNGNSCSAINCSANKYVAAKGDTSCSTCPTGTSSLGGNAITSCTPLICSAGSYISGNACILEPVCGANQYLEGHVCKTNPTCTSSQLLVGHICVNDPLCLPTQHLVSHLCVNDPVCSSTQLLINHACVNDPICTATQLLVDHVCINDPVCLPSQLLSNHACIDDPICTSGQLLVDHLCINDPICSASQSLIDHVCVNDPICSATQLLVNHACVNDPICTSTQLLIDHVCINDPLCSATQLLVNHVCVNDPICSSGQTLVDHICINNPICTATQLLVGHICINDPICLPTQLLVDHICINDPVCTSGQSLIDHLCVNNPVCTATQLLVGHVCVNDPVCSSSQSLINHVCVNDPVCLSNEKLVSGVCQIVTCPANTFVSSSTKTCTACASTHTTPADNSLISCSPRPITPPAPTTPAPVDLSADICASISVQLPPFASLDICLCLNAVTKFVASNRLLDAAVGGSLKTRLALAINNSARKCPTPLHGSPICSRTCDFTCNSGYTKSGSLCVPTVPIATPTVKMGRRSAALARQQMCSRRAGFEMCPISGSSGLFDCVNTQSGLETCGGCPGSYPSLLTSNSLAASSSGSIGTDCSAIPNVDSVSCRRGSCLIHSCAQGFTLSDDRSSCIADLFFQRV